MWKPCAPHSPPLLLNNCVGGRTISRANRDRTHRTMQGWRIVRMTATFPLAGGCLCGQIRYQIRRIPNAAGICHCKSCRRAAGAESVAWAVNHADAFAFMEGQPRVFQSSEGVERTHCGDCGSTLTYRKSPDSIDVTLATLDDPESLQPTKETWCRDRVSWNALNDSLAHYDERTT